ncbi:hypothetical protein ACIQTX_19230 [Microbacterium sp. NPDC090281]|uniref:hypothetical protein n=1 Tax=Microbacterium sp. NPDC090281 TaxID=3364208 RepID=UPI0038204705
MTSDPIPTVQIDNGYVWAQTTIGTTVYAVGKFDNAREPKAAPGTSLTARSNVLAYDIVSGALSSFAPKVNGVIKAVAASPDGSRIYIGGSFNSVNGKDRWNFAALDAKTGELVPQFAPSIGGSGVYAITTDGSNIYLGGLFTQANGVARKNLAALDQKNGALQPWAPQTDRQVDAMVMEPAGSNVIIGGRFTTVSGNSLLGSGAVNKSTGAVDASWALPKTVKNATSTGTGGIFALATDPSGVYGTGWGAGVFEGTFAAETGTGKVRWLADCHGDHYGVYSTGKVVYTTSHMHSCPTMGGYSETKSATSQYTNQYAEAYTADARGTLAKNTTAGYSNWGGNPAPSAYQWAPDWSVGNTTGLGQAGLSITGAGDMISIGGEFRSVNNGQFEGLVRFSTNPPGGSKDAPRLSGANWKPTVGAATGPGRAQVSIPTNWDRGDLTLTYELYRAGTTAPVAVATADGTWWKRSTVTLEDTTATPGTQQAYTVVARDAAGNIATSESVTATTGAPVYSSAHQATPNSDVVGKNVPTGSRAVGDATFLAPNGDLYYNDVVVARGVSSASFDFTSNGERRISYVSNGVARQAGPGWDNVSKNVPTGSTAIGDATFLAPNGDLYRAEGVIARGVSSASFDYASGNSWRISYVSGGVAHQAGPTFDRVNKNVPTGATAIGDATFLAPNGDLYYNDAVMARDVSNAVFDFTSTNERRISYVSGGVAHQAGSGWDTVRKSVPTGATAIGDGTFLATDGDLYYGDAVMARGVSSASFDYAASNSWRISYATK